eukprot:SAG31_NODE_5215_length_2670_cov_1.691949_4_plen_112_part_00
MLLLHRPPGPPCLTCYSNVEYNLVEGVRITGAGASWRNFPPAAHSKPVDPKLNGSRGLCFDSSQTYMKGGSATYQNSARDVTVNDIDVGVYLGPVWPSGTAEQHRAPRCFG